jgi:hypothetical protein
MFRLLNILETCVSEAVRLLEAFRSNALQIWSIFGGGVRVEGKFSTTHSIAAVPRTSEVLSFLRNNINQAPRQISTSCIQEFYYEGMFRTKNSLGSAKSLG